MEDELKGLDPERARIYKQYAETENKAEKPMEEILKEQRDSENAQLHPAEQAPVESEVKKDAPAEVEAPVETEQEKEAREEKERDKAENLKKALDEERRKRKQLREEKEALEIKLREAESKYVPTEEAPISDYEAELRLVKNKLQSIELLEARREELARQEAIKQNQIQLEKMITDVASDLNKEGYPGFRFMAGEVTKELLRMNSEDPEEAQSLDNKDGWKKIYKEKVYPSFKEEFEVISKQNVMDNKKALKKEANLSTSTGKVIPKNEDDPATWSEERKRQEYYKARGLTPPE